MQRINARFFLLDLETEAGTYVKEFVHGDMGRTQPSLAGRTPPRPLLTRGPVLRRPKGL
jgi:tRNA U54 and U55 pseudouridine synthase Pus10